MKAAKVAARVPLALVSVGTSEIVYLCVREPHAPPALSAVEEWAGLTPEGRLDTCWEQLQAAWAASNSAYPNSGWMNQQPQPWDQSKDASHHRKGHKHHHGHGC